MATASTSRRRRLPGRCRPSSHALGDPTLELTSPIPGSGGLVGTDGGPAVLTRDASRQHTGITIDRRTLAVAGHRAGLLDDTALASALAEAGGLALEHEGLTAELAARLRQVRGSRARVVAAGDAERRRLEQDLHDGAQQPLASIALNLQLLEGEQLPEAQAHLRAALDHLRALAHGIFPRALAGEGLDSALEDLAEEAARPVALVGTAPRAGAPAEATAYLVVAAATGVPGDRLTVTTGGDAHRLVVTVDGDTPPLSPALRDRVDALGGALAQGPHGFCLELPCES